MLVLTPSSYRAEFEFLARFPRSYRYTRIDVSDTYVESLTLDAPGRTLFVISGDPAPLAGELAIGGDEGGRHRRGFERAAQQEGNRDRLVEWIAIDAATDRRKRDRPHVIFPCQSERALITRGEQRRFAPAAAVPDGAHRVNHVARRQSIAARDARLAGRAAAERAAFGQQFRSGRAVDRTVDAAAAQQRRIGRVDDRVDVEPGDVDILRGDDGVRHDRNTVRSLSFFCKSASGQAWRAIAADGGSGVQ